MQYKIIHAENIRETWCGEKIVNGEFTSTWTGTTCLQCLLEAQKLFGYDKNKYIINAIKSIPFKKEFHELINGDE